MTTITCTPLKNWMILATATVLGSGCLSPEEQCMKLGGGYNGADIAAIEAECLAEGGTNCDSEEYLEVEAAECLAMEAGLLKGTRGFHSTIYYYPLRDSVLWDVSTLDFDEVGPTCVLNATSGEILVAFRYY